MSETIKQGEVQGVRPLTKAAFLQTYQELLEAEPGYHWAQDPARLARFMLSVQVTINTQANTWNLDSPVAQRAWKAIGGQGRVTYRGLRGLQP